MANIAPQKATLSGLNATFTAASAGGDVLPPLGAAVFVVKNGDASSKTVTVATPGYTEFGVAQPDLTVTVPAGETRYIGPLTPRLTDPTSKGINVSYSAVTSVTVAVIAL